MPWNSGLKKLADLLVELYPSEMDSRMVVVLAGLDDTRIWFDSTPSTNWFNILNYVDRRGQIGDLVDAACDGFPSRCEELTHAYEEYRELLEGSSTPWRPGGRELVTILARLYPTEEESRQIVTFAGMQAARIWFRSAAYANWSGILEEAHHQGMISPLVETVCHEYPEFCDDLSQALREYQQAGQPAIGTPPLTTVHKGTAAQVFLCYARQDIEPARKLYQALSDSGFKPWMDKKDILPGERWEAVIEAAIRRSDFFLACLSTNSTTKRGFIQREIKRALEVWDQMLMDDIFLIPVRLEECEVPDFLTGVQWVDLYEEDGLQRLLKALQVGLQRRQDQET